MEEAEQVSSHISLLRFMFDALGIRYTLLLPVAGFFSFLLALLIVQRGKGAMSVAALILVVHLPLLVGVYGAIDGLMASYMVIAQSCSPPKPSEWADGISLALVAPQVGLLLMVPGYACAAIGASVRSLAGAEEGKGTT